MAHPLPTPFPVRLIVGIRSAEPALLDKLAGRLTLEFGQVLFHSDRWVKEPAGQASGAMPAGEVYQQWLALAETIDPQALVKIKLHLLRVEQLYMNAQGARGIGVDAVYVDQDRVVRATAVDAPHRLYLGSGLYGEVFLLWRESQGFEGLPWTQPEDASQQTREFFGLARQDLLQRRKQGSKESVYLPDHG